ncbi:Zinc finger MYM-type protein 1-like [Oopsacas minuta]|uniref:Zinc finger MYM-type protein 1-like n=1 Tax=Oopsacas minuta TaxID=111878 RepID=A0AAV7JRR3_9METZ|nr:Zinc finger MYM-type protein 1-like [Oopsacas minuta]
MNRGIEEFMLMKELSSIRYFARQGLGFRGHIEEEGNFVLLLKCRAGDIQGLESWIRDGRYISHDIVNEVLEISAHQILCELLDRIRAEWFALIADEFARCQWGRRIFSFPPMG